MFYGVTANTSVFGTDVLGSNPGKTTNKIYRSLKVEVEDHNTTKNIKRRKCPLQIYRDLSSTILGLFLFWAFRAFYDVGLREIVHIAESNLQS